MDRKKISITASCYNEEGNLQEFYDRCRKVLGSFPQYDYEFVVADNCSGDNSRAVLRSIAEKDPNFKVIFNSRNFGHIRSPYNAFLAASGDAVITLCSDLQEPPEIIADFIRKWEEGYPVVVGVRKATRNGFFMESIRRIYYFLLNRFSQDGDLVRNFTGFGLYGRCFMDALKKYHEPYPYFRGLVSEIGFRRAEIPFVQDRRKSGKTKNNLFTLYDMALTGFVNHTKLPLRMTVFFGFILAVISLIIALVYLIGKLLYWHSFELGLAPMMVGLFFFAGVQLICLGIIGEYVGAIWTQVKDKPLVIEEERINFGTPEK